MHSEDKLNIYAGGHAKQPVMQAMPQQLRIPLFLIPHFLVSKLRTPPLFTYTSLNSKTHNTYFLRVPFSLIIMPDPTPPAKLFGRQRSIHDVLGGGTVADVLLWRQKPASAGLLFGIAVIWFLVEVAEYNFMSLLCQMLITTMLVVFIWCTVSEYLKGTTFNIPEIILDEAAFKAAASIFHARLNQFLSTIIYIGCGKDLSLFFLTLVSLGILSVIGNYLSFCNILFLGLLCLETLPFLYERYEEDVERQASIMHQQIKKMYSEFDSSLFNKIPRGPVKEKKTT